MKINKFSICFIIYYFIYYLSFILLNFSLQIKSNIYQSFNVTFTNKEKHLRGLTKSNTINNNKYSNNLSMKSNLYYLTYIKNNTSIKSVTTNDVNTNYSKIYTLNNNDNMQSNIVRTVINIKNHLFNSILYSSGIYL